MSEFDSRFFGQWDVYSQGMHSALHLDQSGNYIHILVGTPRRHWGNWSIEQQNGAAFLVLRLAGATPMMENTPYGVRPIVWPSFEASAIFGVNGDTITLSTGTMVRQQAVSFSPTYFPSPAMATPFAPAVMQSTSWPAGPHFGNIPQPMQGADPAIRPLSPMSPRPPGITIPPEPQLPKGDPATIPQSVYEQWKKDHEVWNEIRNIATTVREKDHDEDLAIQESNTGMQTAEYVSWLKGSNALTEVLHKQSQDITDGIYRDIR